jgi:hypothetical protein
MKTDELLKELNDQIQSIELSEDEIKAALFEGKLKKWNHERNKDFWKEKEAGAYPGDKAPMTGTSF